MAGQGEHSFEEQPRSQRPGLEQVSHDPSHYYDGVSPANVALHPNKPFTRLPQLWVRGGIPALMDRVSPNLWRLFTHLWVYGNLPKGQILVGKGTLAREAGLKTVRTLNRKLAILETGDLEKGLPPLLRALPESGEYRGHHLRYIFNRKGMALLNYIAEENIKAEKKRRVGISKARRKAGQTGARARWASEREHRSLTTDPHKMTENISTLLRQKEEEW